MATPLDVKMPYPDRNLVKTDADARIFQRQIANERNSTRNWARGIVRYRGSSMLPSEPNGIMLAAMFVPKIDTIHEKAERKTAKRVLGDQYRFKMALKRSQGFQRSKPQELLIAAVARIPSEADKVTAMGLVTNCDHCAPVLVLDHLVLRIDYKLGMARD